MDLEFIKKRIKSRNPKPLGIKRRYSVLLPLIYVEEELHILYEVRSQKLSTQPGEISFPGGAVEEGENFIEAAIRETSEELKIREEDISVIGELDYTVSLYNFELHVYCGMLKGIEKENIYPSKDEVDHVFTVPLKFLLENSPTCHNIELQTVTNDEFPYHLVQNGRNYNWRKGSYPVYFYEYNEYIIWGMTARFTNNFIDILKGEKR